MNSYTKTWKDYQVQKSTGFKDIKESIAFSALVFVLLVALVW